MTWCSPTSVIVYKIVEERIIRKNNPFESCKVWFYFHYSDWGLMENPVTTLSKWDSWGLRWKEHSRSFWVICFFDRWVKWSPERLSGLPKATHLVSVWLAGLRLWTCLSGLFPRTSWKPCRQLVLVEREEKWWESQEPKTGASHSQNWDGSTMEDGDIPTLWPWLFFLEHIQTEFLLSPVDFLPLSIFLY